MVAMLVSHHIAAVAPPKVFSATAANAIGLEAVTELFEDKLGGVNNENNPGPLTTGYREINWDAPIVPFNMPGNFFRATVTRGLQVIAKQGKFAVSNDPNTHDNRFSTFLGQYPGIFKTFSPQRLFTPVLENKMWIRFFVPGTNKALGQNLPALVRGFGIIFTDVDFYGKTKLILFDQYDRKIGVYNAQPKNNGLTFLGVILEKTDPRGIKRVRVILGNAKVGFRDGAAYDVVTMDNFFYGEPIAVSHW
eukprot:CAMPEP_0184678838 /NCGR_PEP_ID=MMETSP0312-20130426/1651_1 /TAXON_ID=31354 /ORGANISM="Compsopogon coeruleus, Strain SAG 36.94" /LENGTH=248 /DNA_ID=CAMNT_0027127895 /DNA_START=112 /DNA_END=855 /DNA_ORIENTATION=-